MNRSELGARRTYKFGELLAKDQRFLQPAGHTTGQSGHLAAASEVRQFDLRGTKRATQALGRARHAVRGSYAPDASLRADMHIDFSPSRSNACCHPAPTPACKQRLSKVRGGPFARRITRARAGTGGGDRERARTFPKSKDHLFPRPAQAKQRGGRNALAACGVSRRAIRSWR